VGATYLCACPYPMGRLSVTLTHSACVCVCACVRVTARGTGTGAEFTVGDAAPVAWVPGRAFCFDDSYVHEARHYGTEERYVLLLGALPATPSPPSVPWLVRLWS
jgi:hypothetical protein